MHPNRDAGARGQVQHVARTQQLLCPALVQNGSRVHFGADGECNASRNVGFDQTRNDINRWPLGGKYQVNSRCPGLLGDACDQFLHLFADNHHHVGKLVYYDNDAGQGFKGWADLFLHRCHGQLIGLPGGIVDRGSRGNGVRHLTVVAGQVTHPQ